MKLDEKQLDAMFGPLKLPYEIRDRDVEYMEVALKFAKKAAAEGEVPVGAAVARNGIIFAVGYNRREKDGSVTGHAEIQAIENAAKRLGRWQLDDCEMFVTLEPCPMCAGAIINARLFRVCWGAPDAEQGCFGSVINMAQMPFAGNLQVRGCVMQKECAKVMSDFFKTLRGRKRKKRAVKENDDCKTASNEVKYNS